MRQTSNGTSIESPLTTTCRPFCNVHCKSSLKCRLIEALFLTMMVIFAIEVVSPLPPAFGGSFCDPKRYRENPQVRKKRSQDHLMKAMRLNAQVELMLRQGSDEVDKMYKMLEQSYGEQVNAISAMEGLLRESCVKDPMLQPAIDDMYQNGKPPTAHAGSMIKAGEPDSALQDLAIAKQAHMKFMRFTY